MKEREDHVGTPIIPLDESIRQLVEASTGCRPAGPIRLLTHFRYFGYVFNPVSFYFCYDRSDRAVDAIVAEITNTPWGERHCYVLRTGDNRACGRRKHYRFDKVFHISPFIDMDVAYDWRFTEPASQLAIHMETLRDEQPFFDATMRLERRELSGSSLARVLVQYPLMTLKVIGAIHWQALEPARARPAVGRTFAHGHVVGVAARTHEGPHPGAIHRRRPTVARELRPARGRLPEGHRIRRAVRHAHRSHSPGPGISARPPRRRRRLAGVPERGAAF